MKKLSIFVFIMLFTIGCSKEVGQEPLSTEYKEQIENQKKEIHKLEEEIRKAKLEVEIHKKSLSDYNSDLTLLDENARKILELIKEERFEEIKREYSIEFEVRDSNITFIGLEDYSFPTKLLSSENPIFISYLNLEQPGIAEIFYIVDTAEGERYRFGMTFEYDETWDFKNIILVDM